MAWSCELSVSVAPLGSCASRCATSAAMFDAFTTSMYMPSERRYAIRSSTIPPDSFGSSVYCAPPPSIRSRSFESAACRNACAPSPPTISWPMCETSKIPAAVRTARTSSITPAYWTGISNPANGTIRPPRARWRSKSGVRCSVSGTAAA